MGSATFPPHRQRSRGTLQPTAELLEARLVPAIGTFTPLANLAPNGGGTMLLQSNGTVLVQTGFNGTDNEWYRLTPNQNGSYVSGTWTQIPSEVDSRQFYFSCILPDGRMLVAGGEYGSGGDTGEIYDPVSNTWTSIAAEPFGDIGDVQGAVLPDGRVILAYRFGPQTRIYTPGPQSQANTGSWVVGPTNPGPALADEEAYALLPATAGGGVLTVNVYAIAAERYAPQAAPGIGSWTIIAPPPVQLWDSAAETGPTVLLNDGRMFVIGSSNAGTPGHTALYNPVTHSWTAGPDIPGGYVADDAPAAVMINGHVLFAADQGSEFNPPSSLFEYDPVANTITPVTPPASSSGNPCYLYRFVQLPNGQVLVSDSGSQLYAYTPAGGPLATWRPTITSVHANGGGLFTLTGRQLNGRSEGTYYGDDVSNASNFPLVRLVNSTGGVFYARTFNWAPGIVQTSPLTSMTTQFRLPAGLPSGSYSLYVVANGIASNRVGFSLPSSSGPFSPFSAGGSFAGLGSFLPGGPATPSFASALLPAQTGKTIDTANGIPPTVGEQTKKSQQAALPGHAGTTTQPAPGLEALFALNWWQTTFSDSAAAK